MLCIQSYNVKPSPRPSGSGVRKIPSITELLDELILDCLVLVCHIFQYFMGTFLGGVIFCYGTCCLDRLFQFIVITCLGPPSLLRTRLVVAQILRTVTRNMPFLLTTVALEIVPIRTCTLLEETSSWPHGRPSSSPLSLALGLIPLPSISSWFVIFCGRKACSSTIYIHCIWMASWSEKRSWASGSRLTRSFKLIKVFPSIQVIPMSLSSKSCPSPLFKRFWLVMLVDGFVKRLGEAASEHVDGLRAVDVVLGMSYQFFKMGDIPIEVLSLHSDPLLKGHACFLFLKGVSELSIK